LILGSEGALGLGDSRDVGEVSIPPPRVFCEKRLQTIENKGNKCGKECKETTKRPQALEKDGFAG
jgi:hypothetical protein